MVDRITGRTPASHSRDAVLFLMLNPAYVRNFEPVLRALGARDRPTTVLFEERKQGGDVAGLALIERLCREYGALRHEFLSPPALRSRGRLRILLEVGQDYLRYFELPYRNPTRSRSRAVAFLPARVERMLASVLRRMPRGRRALATAARRLNERLGDDVRIREELERRRPEALVVTPMVQFHSRQSDWVRVAGGLGIATMLCIHSWDNLTTKGLMHALPDRMAVWNEAQRREAIELHGMPGESVLVAGAWPYDHWFGWRASRSKEELVAELGLPADRAMILYVCSSRFIARRERAAVTRWVRALRTSDDPRVASANVVVRPHPLNGGEWPDRSLQDLPGVAVFPPGGADPVDHRSRSDYFDSLACADAVVGVNTSALVESAIVDRPALALPAPEFSSSQDELPHFHELVGDQGMLSVSESIGDHVAQLSRVLADPTAATELRRRFVESFVRPGDDDRSPTERVVAAVEDLLGRTPDPASGGAEAPARA
jgi:hypothetical protein